jgi:hypothetical protein
VSPMMYFSILDAINILSIFRWLYNHCSLA